jgi:aldehyde:ferredoxin oxidoreductase
MVDFTEAVYRDPPGRGGGVFRTEAGEWEYLKGSRHLDKDRFEEFKTLFYEMQGWDAASGFPTRSTLAGMGLGYVADELEAQGKLGA